MTPTYVCPDCKTPLNTFYCSDCEYEFPRLGEIPRLLSCDRGFAQTEQVAAAYDAIYADRSNVWRKPGPDAGVHRLLLGTGGSAPPRGIA